MSGRWLPSNEVELEAGLSSGLGAEGHFFDAKRELAPGATGSRKLAVDVASFAVDGGLIVVGVAEDKEQRTFSLHPVPLAGLAERVDQVARSLVDPPLQVACTEVLASTAGTGYLLISVPASPLAPHMVDGKYRGRGDTTNVVLSDGEVRRLHERAMLHRARATEILRAEIARDPSPPTTQPEAHLFVIAQPVTADDELLFRAVGAEGLAGWVRSRVQQGAPCRNAGTSYSPDLGSMATEVSRRADGVALATYQVGPGRVPRPNGPAGVEDTDMLELEVREDGGLRLFCGRGSKVIGDEEKRVAFEAAIAGLTIRVLLVAAEVVATTGYGGSWDLGLAVTHLRGCHAYSLHNQYGSRFIDVPYSADSYEQVVRVDSDALVRSPVEVLESLYGRLHRGLSGGDVPIRDLVARFLSD
jgi:hypothetical protein